jgi:hypothetical protein
VCVCVCVCLSVSVSVSVCPSLCSAYLIHVPMLCDKGVL